MTLHHVGLELSPEDLERSVELWQLLGFERVEPPASLAEFTWLQREGTQVHLMPADSAAVPSRGHVAVVVADFEETLAKLATAGFEAERRGEHWGAPRAKVVGPGGHVVELMASPPPSGG